MVAYKNNQKQKKKDHYYFLIQISEFIKKTELSGLINGTTLVFYSACGWGYSISAITYY